MTPIGVVEPPHRFYRGSMDLQTMQNASFGHESLRMGADIFLTGIDR
jgi:hypothetical protein